MNLRAGTPHVSCPIHKKTFALESGDCLSDPGAYHVLTFRAKAVDGRIFVELQDHARFYAAASAGQ